jgi:hypothetical protein
MSDWCPSDHMICSAYLQARPAALTPRTRCVGRAVRGPGPGWGVPARAADLPRGVISTGRTSLGIRAGSLAGERLRAAGVRRAGAGRGARGAGRGAREGGGACAPEGTEGGGGDALGAVDHELVGRGVVLDRRERRLLFERSNLCPAAHRRRRGRRRVAAVRGAGRGGTSLTRSLASAA